MSDSIFKEGGPYDIRKTGSNEYSFSIPIPKDEYGRVGRQCPCENCSPGYFKVKLGTGITGGQQVAYCPYCRHKDTPNEFQTTEQVRYGKDVLTREAQKGIQNILGDALGIGPSGSKTFGGGMFSMEMKYNQSPLPTVRPPFEEEIQRIVICPHCGLDQAVFGIAIWCADCGQDIFLTHVQAELAVVSSMLSDIDRRRTTLGHRVAGKDIENCLEDTVSIFEAVLKALATHHLRDSQKTEEEIQIFLSKKVGTAFQNIDRTAELLLSEFHVTIHEELPPDLIPKLKATFEKRHPITHNLGMVDRKYLERTLSAAKEGHEIRVTKEEIETAIAATSTLLQSLHSRLIRPQDKV